MPSGGTRVGDGRRDRSGELLNDIAGVDGRSFGAVLRALRRRRLLSQAELAARAGISERTVRNLESDIVVPRASTVRLLGAALGLTGSAEQELFQAPGPHAVSAGPVPAELPFVAQLVVGRQAELAMLDGALAPTTPSAQSPLAILTGLPGAGKTTLAVHWARTAATRFPDGQLFLDLHGFDALPPVSPAVALGQLLEALGVAPSAMPAGTERRAALYRSLLVGKRALVVLDNARDAAQVVPLLPGGSPAGVLVTARNRLLDVLASHAGSSIEVHPLKPPESRAMLVGRLGAARVDADPHAVARIVRACSGLPLSLAAVGARAAAHPAFPLSELAQELEEAEDRLDGAEDVQRITVRAAFAHSFRALPGSAEAVFRSFGVHPGPDLDPPAAAALCDLPVPRVRSALARLAEANLVVEHVPGRFRVLELMRPYAVELDDRTGTASSRRVAVDRLLTGHVLPAAGRAAALLDRFGLLHDAVPSTATTTATTRAIVDHGAALRWFAAERPNMVAIVEWADRAGRDAACWQLAHLAAHHLRRHGRWVDLERVQLAALAAARRQGDARGQADSHRHLAGVALRAGDNDRAWGHLGAAFRCHRAVGDREETAESRMALANALLVVGRRGDALREARRALTGYAAAGNAVGVARSLNAIGWDHHQLGEHGTAVECCRRSVHTLEDAHDHAGAGAAWDSLGHAHLSLGEPANAVTSYRHAIERFERVGAQEHRVDALEGLGDCHAHTGHPDRAQEAWLDALAVRRSLDQADDDLVAKLDHVCRRQARR
jgi:transcriptional regulator with XRE-family HTH domain/tetratricopeptide (TPR) repeat protein